MLGAGVPGPGCGESVGYSRGCGEGTRAKDRKEEEMNVWFEAAGYVLQSGSCIGGRNLVFDSNALVSKY